ncbi:MAG TPA: SDR family NAD(P)-dependent oxidoreductase [Chitinophagaceae bacterium]|nr:SDR family NAD(P)-dependent oxidoreductase [Chitinophagaceae bacterium]
MPDKNFALITGASEGFGKAMALECAARNMNLVLVALPGSALNGLASFIERNYGVNVLFFEHDLSKKEDCIHLFEKIKDKEIPVNVLINNAALGGTHFFEEKDPEYYYKQIELNVVAPTLLTHLFLQTLEKNSPAHILNVGSLASFFFLPKKGVYGGTKSYLISFSKSLRKELKAKNVFVSAVCPGGMNTTPMLILQNKQVKGLGRWSIMNPEEVAKITIDGMLARKELIIPGFWNRMFMLFDKLLPKWYKEMLTDNTMKKSKTFNNPVIFPMQSLKPAV